MKIRLYKFIGFLSFIVVNIYATEHKVAKGDCLWNLAGQYYQNNFLWKKIYEFNKEKIKNPDLIYPEQVFVIPPIDSVTVSSDTTGQQEETTEVQQEKTQSVQEETQSQSEEETISIEKDQAVELQTKTEESQKVEYPKKINVNEQEFICKIIAGKENKFFYTDGDEIFCKMIKSTKVVYNDILYIYHIGASIYDVTLRNVKGTEASLVGKIRVSEVKDDIITGRIIRAYSPIVIGDILIK